MRCIWAESRKKFQFPSYRLNGVSMKAWYPFAVIPAIPVSGRSGKRPLRIIAAALLAAVIAFGSSGLVCASLPKQTQPMPHNFTPHLKIKQGSLLVANKSMRDPRFSGTVIFMLEYGVRGAAGLIINRPKEVDGSKALPGVKGAPDTLYFGGPVDMGRMRILIRAASAPPDARHIFEDVYESPNKELLQRLIDDKEMAEDFHVYAGYAGWAPMQLEREILRGGWRVLTGDVEAVFSATPAEVWSELIRLSAPGPSNEAQPPSSPRQP